MGPLLFRRPARLCSSLLSLVALLLLGSLALQLYGRFTEPRPPRPSPPTPPQPSPPTPSRPSPPSPHSQPPPSPHLQPPPSPHSLPPPPPRSQPPPPPLPPPPPPPSSTSNCTELAERTEGPYWIEENIEASNVRLNVSYGVPLNITFKVANSTLSDLAGTCVPIEAARIDLWQCRYDGLYSDEEEDSTVGETWLRGYQYTNSTGYATFYTIYPGWYTSRTIHIHVRVRVYSEDGNTTLYEDTTQLFFNDTLTDAIFSNIYPYNSRGLAVRDTFNSNDPLFTSTNVMTLDGDYSDSDGLTSTVELSVPFSTSISILENGERLRRREGSSKGFAAIM